MDKPWLGDFLGEIGAFPVGVHDDQVDAFVMPINYLHHGGVMSRESNGACCGYLESWPGESGQRGNWSFCLPAAKMAAEQERT